MSNQRKNRAVIIVNYEFCKTKSREKLPSRPGAKREADRLFKALSKCNYAVRLHYDLTAEEIEGIYEDECHVEHGGYFVSIISSHGQEGSIFDCEGQPVQLTRIFQALSPQRCHNLRGKPKIFFIQVGRSWDKDGEVMTAIVCPPKPFHKVAIKINYNGINCVYHLECR